MNADTLAFIEGVHAKLSYFSLLQKTINLDRVEVSNFYLNIERPHNDSLFNIDAIQLPQASSKLLKEKTSDPWEISMDNVLLKDIWINYLDYYEPYKLAEINSNSFLTPGIVKQFDKIILKKMMGYKFLTIYKNK